MDTSTINIIVGSASSAVVGIAGMLITTSQLAKRVDRLEDQIRADFKEFRTEFKHLQGYAQRQVRRARFGDRQANGSWKVTI